jgi:hypothetical protein
MTDVLKLWWAWRKKADRPLLRSLALAMIALLFTIATVSASILSSLIVSNGMIDVLVESPLCGRINPNGTAWRSYTVNFDRSAASYTLNCYRNGSLPPNCDVFMQPNIPLKVEDAPCPFKNASFCDTKEALSIDSGLKDVGKTFGLNLAAKDRVQFRKKTTCSVLPINGRYRVANLDDLPGILDEDRPAIPGEQAMLLNYGPSFSRPLPLFSFFASFLLMNLTARPAVAT